ncbi:MAG: hypothetical protein LBU06_01480 [Desulfovibrio sp.]|jgi:hypothetical protein|nr:hypothetical protein [Desulfovibrio sp.]
MASSNQSIPWPTLGFSLLGLAWCGWMAFPTSSPAPCLTSGCALFRGSAIGGVSLWWIGGACFFLITLLCLRGKKAAARFLSMAALALDTVLLLVMLFFAPCFDCLVAAALFGLVYYSLRGVRDGWFLAENGPSLLLPVWFGLFLANGILAADETLPRHTLGGHSRSEVRLFFSPSCPACREALVSFGESALLYPVAEASGDVDGIVKLQALLNAGLSMREAVDRSLDPSVPAPELSFFRRALLHVQLLRNKTLVLRQGFASLPLIQVNGMPGFKAGSSGGRGQNEAAPGGRAIPREGRARLSGSESRDPLHELLQSAGELGSCLQGADAAACGEDRRSARP